MERFTFLAGRRHFLHRSSALALATVGPSLALVAKPAAAAGKQMTLVSWGGTYRHAVETALVEPFTKETGIRVTIVDTPDLAKVRAQVTTNNVQWDVFDAPNALGDSGAVGGLWEPLDPSLFDQRDLVIGIKNNLLPFYLYSGGIAWDPKRYGKGKHPRNFEEYFDTRKFPGFRTFRDRPSETLEAALLSDGVSPKSLYPLDVDRAFKALDRIKSHVVKWVGSTPQTISLLTSGETDFTYTYAGRVKTAQASGVSVDFSFDQTINGFEYLAVVKNAPNKAEAMKFLAFAARPDRQAAFMDILGYAPASKKAVSMMSAEARRWVPDLDSPNSVLMNDAWWTPNFESLTRRFKEWILS